VTYAELERRIAGLGAGLRSLGLAGKAEGISCRLCTFLLHISRLLFDALDILLVLLSRRRIAI